MWDRAAGHLFENGASGPALMDGWWRYGPDPVSAFVSIRDGQPHGMPPFRNKLTTEQIWQLTYYLRALGSIAPRTEFPNRDDAMHAHPAENRGPGTFEPSKPVMER
jgi:cytochrome c oxidase cbb3-type subunit III